MRCQPCLLQTKGRADRWHAHHLRRHRQPSHRRHMDLYMAAWPAARRHGKRWKKPLLKGGSEVSIFIRIASPIIIVISLLCILYKISEESSEELLNNLKMDRIVLRLPKAYMWVGCGCVLAFSAFILVMLYYPNGTETMWVIAVFAFFVLLGCAIILKAKVWRIELFRSKDYFFVRDLLRKTYCVSYRDCTNYSFDANRLRLKTEKGQVCIDLHAINFEFLLAMLKQHKVEEYKRP